jgi:hypothetical protein
MAAWRKFAAQFDGMHVPDDTLIAAFNIAWHAGSETHVSDNIEQRKAEAREAIRTSEERIEAARVELTAAINASAAAHNVLNDIQYHERHGRTADPEPDISGRQDERR